MALKAVIFDFDGTLYSKTAIPVFLVLGNIFNLRAIRAERKALRELAGRYFENSKDYFDELFRTMSRKGTRSAAYYEKWYWKKYMPLMVQVIAKRTHPRPNIKTFIDAFHSKGLKVAILSDYPMVKAKLQALNVDPSLFDAIYESPTMGGLKPCGQTFLSVCQSLGVKPVEAVMIGDKIATDGGASKVGMNFRHVTSDDEWNFICISLIRNL